MPKHPASKNGEKKSPEDMFQNFFANHAVIQQKMRKKLNGNNDDDSSDGGDMVSRTKGKGFNDLHRWRKGIRKKPKKSVRRYVQKVARRIGIQNARQAFIMSDYSRKLQILFGKMRGLFRIHVSLQEAIQEGIEGDTLPLL